MSRGGAAGGAVVEVVVDTTVVVVVGGGAVVVVVEAVVVVVVGGGGAVVGGGGAVVVVVVVGGGGGAVTVKEGDVASRVDDEPENSRSSYVEVGGAPDGMSIGIDPAAWPPVPAVVTGLLSATPGLLYTPMMSPGAGEGMPDQLAVREVPAWTDDGEAATAVTEKGADVASRAEEVPEKKRSS